MFFKTKVFIFYSLSLICWSQADSLTQNELKQVCNGIDMQLILYPTEPTKYLLCLNGDAFEKECQTVDVAGSAVDTCFDDKLPGCTADKCTETTTNSKYSTFVKEYCQENEYWLVSVPAEDCNHYYVCMGPTDEPHLATCANNMHYSRENKKCMSQFEAGCAALEVDCTSRMDGFKFASNNCYEYYECVNSKAEKKSCKYNEHFQASTSTCISAVSSQCPARVPTCTVDDNGLYLAHPICSKFYVCINKMPYEAACAQGYYFDAPTQMCQKGTCTN